MGWGVRGNLPNSLDRSSNWEEKVTARGELRQKRVVKRGRTVGKKETFIEGEAVKLQDMISKKWCHEGTIIQVRSSADGTIASYDIETANGSMTTRHRKYIQKICRPGVSIEDSQRTEQTDPARTDSGLSRH